MASHMDLLELSRHLKQERLYVSSEREQLQTLNDDVVKTAEQLNHLAWVMRQQKLTLDQLILAEKGATPEVCCRRANNLETVNFVDGYKNLSYHESKIGEFLKLFRENPKLVAACLVHCEKSGLETMQKLARIVITSLYGNSVMQEDETLVLHLLKGLIELQVSPNDNPRRLLRKGSCAFSTIFKLLNESMFAAKLFLTAALHKPVMQLLMEDEWFYDIDPERALYRFPPQDRIKRFGQPGTSEYQQKTEQYREQTANKLVTLAERFIVGIKNNMHCFPQSLSWIVSQLYQCVTKAQRVNGNEARAMCADLIFAMFICPAVCDPEPFGITSDAPISYIARHNLMQVAQILQMLAISGWEEIDPKTKDIYGKFEKGCMSSVLDMLLERAVAEQPPQANNQLQGCSRASVLITFTELLDLMNFIRNLVSTLEEANPDRKALEDLLKNVPQMMALQGLQPSPGNTPQPTPPGTPPVHNKKFTVRGKARQRLLLLTADILADHESDEREATPTPGPPEDVLVISLGVINECPGMLTENKVLEQENKQRKVKYNNYIPGEDESVSGSEVVQLTEKRTRFSLSHDQDSIATSDNLEAISEAASSHSVGSDIEDNENDNLSDMVSANVSGRGTPNISGRDTPLSQAESAVEGQEERARAPDLPVIVQKSNREDVTERFGKFEIKAELERDETKSTVSDTWSTDVLASDSEPPEQNQLERLEEIAEEMVRHNLLGVQEIAEISETASDAWSTDVLASDTSERQADRLLELDQDEVASVSSRSQGQDDSVSEIGDQPEDGSQSGLASPGLGESAAGCPKPRPNSGGATGGSGATGGTAFFPANQPIPEASVTIRPTVRPERFSDPTNFNYQSYSGAEANNGNLQNRAMSELVGNFQTIEQSKRQQAVNAHNDQASRNNASMLQAFDPLVPSKSAETLTEGTSELNVNVNTAMGGSTQTLVPEGAGALSPDQGFTSPGTHSDHSQFDVMSSSTAGTSSNRDSGIPATPSDSMDTLSESMAGGLKLTEQQNTHIDAHRLSSAAITLFDPLMQESSTDPDDIDPLSGPSPEASIGPRGSNPFNNNPQSYNDQGARPKIPNHLQNSMPPRISVQSSEAEVNGYPQGAIFDNSGKPSGRKEGSGRPLPDPEIMKNAESDNLSQHSTDSAHKHRSSTDSSNSSLVDAGSNASTPRSQRNEDDEKLTDSKKKTSFFASFKDKISKSASKSKRKFPKPFDREDGGRIDQEKGAGDRASDNPDDSPYKHQATPRPHSEEPKENHAQETSDDILAKYRKQPAPSDSTNQMKDKSELRDDSDSDSSPAYDPNNLESCKAFLDAKRKLRLVLSTADFQALPASGYQTGLVVLAGNDRKDNDLVGFLQVQLAEAINLQDKDLIAQLHETIRCLRLFDNDGIRKLLKALKEEYKGRSPYIAYLVRCRQGLLSSLAHLDRQLNRVKRDKSVVNKYFISVFVRLFLEKKERALMKFISDFQKLTMADEKAYLLEQFLEYLATKMQEDPTWQAATESQLEDAKQFIERNVMSHIYTHAMYPNGDGDIHRDLILHNHMKKLAKIITPNHKDLRIPKMYHYECPWPAAQNEIYMINAYKTPRDKLQCVLRCSSTIMNLLSMANEHSVPAADDFMPVLIFVLIKANPLSLLSSIQYINSFYDKRLAGEEQYWWMQFSSAVEFIKTMD